MSAQQPDGDRPGRQASSSAGAAQADRLIDRAGAIAGGAAAVDDRRIHERCDYEALVGMIPIGPDGGLGKPMVLRAGDISSGGMRLVSGRPLAEGGRFVLQLCRANGAIAMACAIVRHARSIGPHQIELGLKFQPMPAEVDTAQLLDEHGSLRPIDTLLEQNVKR